MATDELSPLPAAAAGPPAAEPEVVGHPVGRRRRVERLTIAGLLAPALTLFVVLVLLPMVIAAWVSLFKWNGFGGWPKNFVGVDNYTKLVTDDVFVGDLRRGLIIVVLTVVIQLPLALALSVLLNQRLVGRNVFRVLFFAPYILSEVITGVLFVMIFSPENGLVNFTFRSLGFGDLGSTWLSDPSTVLYSLFFVITWKFFGFHMMLYLAGQQAIPKELTEAAATDGANQWQAFRHITLPLLGPTIRISIFLSVIGTIQLFDLVWVLTRGGPLHASETLAVTMFQYGFRRSAIGYASATSIAMLVISLGFALIYQRFVLRRDLEGAVTTMRGTQP